MGRKVLIVGGVAGGASAAARLRRLDEQAEIILFERGEHISFANCGLPYYIGRTITNRDELLIQTPANFKARFNIDVRIKSEVTGIDRKNKQIEVKDQATGKTYTENYEKLILSPGAAPVRPPLPGIDSDRIFTLRNIADMDAIDKFMQTNQPRRALIVGAGYIGLEMAENLHQRGITVGIVEMLDQVMPLFDKEIANILLDHLQSKKVAVWLGDGVAGFEQDGSNLKVRLKSSTELNCDFVVLAIGVRPEVKLAKQTDIELGSKGGIKTDEYMRTNDPDIYAIGDAVEVRDFVLGTPTLIPLAGPANKQGRIAADNICGKNIPYKGTQGTGILKVFDLTAAMTGASEKTLKNTDIEHEKVYLHPASHAGYYPGAKPMHIKLMFSKPQGRVLGAQIIGSIGVDKRIDVIATAIRAEMTVFDLQELELAYAPPYGSAKDPVNMAGYIAGNILDGTIDVTHWQQINGDNLVLDVRTQTEHSKGSVPDSINIPVDDLRKRLKELPKDRVISSYCGVGIRSYIASRILKQNGFRIENISGGFTSYRYATYVNDNEAAMQLKDRFLGKS